MAVYYACCGALAGSRGGPRPFGQVLKEEDFMSLSRRHFFGNLGLGSVGLLSAPFIIGRGREALAFEAEGLQPPDDGGFIRISSNENARGPGKKTIDALRNTISPRVGRGYPPDYTGDSVATIADVYGIGRDHVIVGTGSGPILEAATRAFCSAQKPLVTAAPTYGTCDQAARRIGAPVKMITVDKSLGLDTDAMAEAAKGAGMISSATRTTRPARSTTRRPWRNSSAASNRARRRRES